MNRCEDIDKPYIDEEEIVNEIRDLHSQIYKKGYEDGRDWGRREMWECAKEIVGMWADIEDKELKNIFGFDDIVDIFKNLSFSKAREKIEEYKTTPFREIKVGDELDDGDQKSVVVQTSCEYVYAVSSSGTPIVYGRGAPLSKTGRYFPEIVGILDQMKEEKFSLPYEGLKNK